MYLCSLSAPPYRKFGIPGLKNWRIPGFSHLLKLFFEKWNCHCSLLDSKWSWFFRHKSPSIEACGNPQAKSCCKTRHYLMSFLQSFLSTGSLSWLNYPCSVLRQEIKRVNIKTNPRNLSNSSAKGLSSPGTGCSGQWWSPLPWRNLKTLRMWHMVHSLAVGLAMLC